MRDLFAQDPGRFARFSREACGIFVDYSKHRVTDETMKLLFALARAGEGRRAGATGCSPARRSTAPRTARCCTSRCATASNRPILVDGKDVMPEVNARPREDARVHRRGAQRRLEGATPASASPTSSTSASAARDLGPVMATEALKPYWQAGPARALRLQRRRHAPRRDAQGGSTRRHALHRRVARPSPRRRR